MIASTYRITLILALSGVTANALATDRLVPAQFATIQAAIDAASPGDSVIIADGTYTGAGNKNLDFDGKAIAVRSASGDPTLCIIDCQSSGRGVHFHSGETRSAVLQGITIENGRISSGGPSLFGGGIFCENSSSPTIRNCVIDSCVSGGSGVNAIEAFGGGIAIESGAGPLIESCAVTNNEARAPNDLSHGGGISIRNAGSVILDQCTISGNTAGVSPVAAGGGLATSGAASLLIRRCRFDDNEASGNQEIATLGGGANITGTAAILANCVVVNNRALSVMDTSTTARGGGLYLSNSSKAVNCFIANNVVTAGMASGTLDGTAFGAGAVLTGASRLFNCTVIDNTVSAFGTQSTSAAGGGINGGTVLNSIVRGNVVLINGAGAGSGVQLNGSTARYCDVEGGYSGTGNVDVDPLFVGEFRLASNSPVMDAGSNGAVLVDTVDLDDDADTGEPTPLDIDDGPRFADGPVADTGDGTAPIVDMGAAEYSDCDADGMDDGAEIAAGTADDCDGNGLPDTCQPDANTDGIPDACDCNFNGVVDSDDIAMGTSDDVNGNDVPDECEGDSDLDGVVDVIDNCPMTPNADQADFDQDTLGDLCDDDDDNDGLDDGMDVCPFTAVGAAVDADGRPLGDIDVDCDTDLVDFGLFQSGFTGPTP